MLIGIVRRLGPLGRRLGWDHVFRRGAWFAGPRRPEFAALVRGLAAGRNVLELACGDGSRSWVALDVSPEAIRIAGERRDVPVFVAFGVAGMATCSPTSHTDLVIIEEALYYLTRNDRLRLLRRCLEGGARVLVTVHDAVKHAATLADCEREGCVIELHQWGESVAILLGRPA
jgi:hypothetical protein